ncbi:hypothetical protein K4K48_010209 [Colletotrichum sp. SAR 10_66]|nr:hypothetical protein K4K48_010209 [Colletotrichum sp. SAR 10_66]
MTHKQRESFAPMRRAGAVVEQLQDVGRKQARTVERAQEKTLRLVHDPAALWSKHDPPPPPPPPPQPLGQEMAEVASNVCGWNTVLEERISDKTQRLIEGEARHSNSMSPKYLLLRIYFFFVDNWPRRATKGTTGEVLKWEDQANVIRNEITKWRRRKSKASVLCKTLTVGAGKTAILLKAIQNEETHLGEMAQGAKDLLAEVLSQGVNASNNALQHLSKTARDLCIAYLQSFQQHYPNLGEIQMRSGEIPKVCKSDVEHLCILSTKIVFGAGCKRFMWQHVIRFKLCPKHTIFKRWGDIALKLYAVRPDGSSWTETWDLAIRPKIQAAMTRYASEAVKLGLVREEDGERVWEDWSKGFLSDEWDGSTFDEHYARRLLQKVSDAEDAERRKDRRTQDEMEALRAQLVGLGHVPVVPPPRNEDSDDGSKDRQRPAPAEEPARRGRNEEDEDDVVPGDSISRVVVSSDALPAEPIPVASDVARVFDDISLAELENWLRRGWAQLFDLRAHMFDVLFPLAVGRERGRQPDNDHIIAIREAREKLLEEIFFLEDVIDDRRRPFGARHRRYPGQGLVYKYFLGGDGPSPAIEARVLEAQRPYL